MVQESDPLLLLPNTFRPFYGAFTGLRPIQTKAIPPIIQGRDLILQAATGSGKTEAVLAPALERVIASGRRHTMLYIIPTRALAKDLMRRFEPVITERLDLILAIRTGDIKKGGNKRPDIMFTTPESLDVMLGSANAGLKTFLARVGTVIIDEVHPLVHQYRGRHLVYLLTRLERKTGTPIQKIAMSATIGDIPEVMAFLNFRPGGKFITAGGSRKIRARLLHLKDEKRELPALLNDLYREWAYKKILIFCNSRSACDRLSYIVRRTGIFREVTGLHYANLKAKERKKVEERFRKNPHALCIATATLELGIDVGDVDAVILYHPPGSVSTFLQRIGRANRRGDAINFWGITSGENAGTQVIRFLALLELGRRGKIESPAPKTLPSVLSQQVISCLYEKKEISINALKDLFPDHKSLLPEIFKALEKKGWLKRSRRPGLLHGSWQYRNHFMAYKIWGNFPESEKEYVLEVEMESIADIPQSIVDQMEVGDRVYLSGRRLKILKIQEGDPGKVTARPAMEKDDKDLAWAGLGAHVSWETAQAMGRILAGGTPPEKSGLMARTKRLFRHEMKCAENRVRLANGIEVTPGIRARFHFRTFLGSAGNLVLEWAVRDHFQGDDLDICANETGVECSRWINFQELNLPVEKEAFHIWVSSHFRVLKSLIPLSMFWKTLPRHEMVNEVADFLFDCRVADTFARYLESDSNIVSGDMADLAGPTAPAAGEDIVVEPVFETDAGDDLLSREKMSAAAPQDSPFLSPGWQAPCLDPCRDPARPLTATMIYDYIFHGQCDRRFCLSYLGLTRPIRDRDDLMALARERGLQHEQAVLAALEQQGHHPATPAPPGPDEHRWEPSLRLLEATMEQMKGLDPETARPARLFQCYIKAEGLIPGLSHIPGIGIPDLLKISAGQNGQAVITAGDIKGSQKPAFHHKWQVAFYALVLEQTILRHHLPARISHQGFIITPPARDKTTDAQAYQIHEFDLTPYLAALPHLLDRLGRILSGIPALADYRLQTSCTACSGFPGCYHGSLNHEDIQLLPRLTRGELAVLRRMNCATLEQLSGALQKDAPFLSPGQQKKLSGWCDAFLTGRIRCHKKKTHGFPANLSRCIFIHMEKNPLDGLPRVLGWQVLDADGRTTIRSNVWTMETCARRDKVRQTFLREMKGVWKESIHSGLGPHIFHFGSQTPTSLLQWLEGAEDDVRQFPGRTRPSHFTDLQKVLTAHFYMPAPGIASLYTLGRIFGCRTAVKPPPTLFHQNSGFISDAGQAAAETKNCLSLMAALYRTALSRLESQWIKEWPPAGHGKAQPYTRFIQEEQRLKEADIMMLQEQPIEERMLRFRSLGYLKFHQTRLDSTGRFMSIFKPTARTRPAKFRPGDFLKLVPQGMADIQNGFPVIMAEFNMEAGDIGLISRSGKMRLKKGLFYSLEEDMDDWNREKLYHTSQTLFSDGRYSHIRQLLAGAATQRQARASSAWVEKWLDRDNRGLNPSQQQALRLPFQYRTAMIQGPPGTGKTHLLGWIIIALILEAHGAGKPLRIGISALTHKAIDTVLKKVVKLVNRYLPEDFPGQCVKWGEEPLSESGTADTDDAPMRVEYTKEARDLPARPWLILGATGYGFYSLFNSKDKGFPQALDWMIFDEASQVPVPQALLSLIYGRGNFLFLGDVHQLPPIVMGNYDREDTGNRLHLNESILSNIRNLYPKDCQVTLDITYRMNKEICAFPSKTWYHSLLRPDRSVENARLCLDENQTVEDPILEGILNPEQPVALVLTDHQGCSQQSDVEADLMAALVRRLILSHGLAPDRMAVITPHRAQNNAILQRLGNILADHHSRAGETLPLVDTVERIQGAERDVILFGLTASDPDHLTSEFLNSPNRLNVAMTRARKKLIIIGSHAFFSVIPDSDALLAKNACFKQLLAHCQAQNAVFHFPAV